MIVIKRRRGQSWTRLCLFEFSHENNANDYNDAYANANSNAIDNSKNYVFDFIIKIML